MKKRIIAIMIVTTMSFCLMACGADNNKEVATEEVVTEIESEQQEIEEPTENTQIVDSDFFSAIVNQYKMEVEAGIKLIKEYYAMKPFILSEFGKDDKTGETIQTGGCILQMDIIGNRDIYHNKLSINTYIKEVRAKYWKALFKNPKFTGQLTNNLQRDFYNRVEELKEYDF